MAGATPPGADAGPWECDIETNGISLHVTEQGEGGFARAVEDVKGGMPSVGPHVLGDIDTGGRGGWDPDHADLQTFGTIIQGQGRNHDAARQP